MAVQILIINNYNFHRIDSWLFQIDAHEDDVNAVAFADGSSQLLFSGSDDALCKVWDRRTLREDRPQPVGQLAGHRDGITFIHSKVRKMLLLAFQADVAETD